MKRHLGASAVVAGISLIATGAWAADPVQPLMPGFSWTGVHFGIGGGYGGADQNVGLDIERYEDGGLVQLDTGDFFPDPVEGLDLYSIGGSIDFGGKGPIGAVEVGYDHQFGRFVVGLQADYTFSSIRRGASIFGDVCYELVDVGDSCDGDEVVIDDTPSLDYTLNTGDVISLSARAGILATPRTLFYAMAGYSHTRLNAEFSLSSEPTGKVPLLSYGYSREGVTVGGGIETLLGNDLSAKLEYRGTMWSHDESTPLGIGDVVIGMNDDVFVQSIRGVLSYRLNTGHAPEPVEFHYDPSAPYSWTGLHVGAGGGYGIVNHDTGFEFFEYDDNGLFGVGGIGGDTGDIDGFDLFSIGAGMDFGGKGGIGTVEGGFDVQIGQYFVVGIQADYTWSDIQTVAEAHGDLCYELDSLTDSCDLDGGGAIVDDTLSATYTLDTGDSWSVIGRAGFLPGPRTLIYGLAGYTHTDMNADIVFSSAEFGDMPLGSYGYARGGLTAGAGIEAMVTNNLSAKLEYRATMWSNESIFSEGPTGIRFWDDSVVQSARAVLSYRLNHDSY